MHLARAAARRGTQTGPGITLLYHYRCMPEIIGYCNTLLYAGRIHNARVAPRSPHLEWMPCMSWVDVRGEPRRVGGSWVNDEEVHEILRWLVAERDRLTIAMDQHGSPVRRRLSDMVAIIAPLTRQAHVLRTALSDALGEDDVREMVIGTVHKLQGAERPVVIFSLTQSHPINTPLMADRDGGMLMNVAVSRARDAFVIFANRATLRPAPMDAAGDRLATTATAPVAALGRYLRNHGSRLYPGVLVIVEAPGKRAAIEHALGPDVAVLATKGHLRQSRIQGQEMIWSPSPSDWLAALAEHAGLIREVVIATDDDLTGELIGMQAADDATRILAQGAKQPVRVRRMRFADMSESSLRGAYAAAGEKFDAQRLAAALVRDFANAIDKTLYEESGLNMSTYASAQARDAVAWLDDARHGARDPHGADTREVCVTLRTPEGIEMDGFVVADQGALALPAPFEDASAQTLAKALQDHPNLTATGVRSVLQKPGLYPANTTARVLALAIDALGLDVQVAQDHMNALYLQGADTAGDSTHG